MMPMQRKLKPTGRIRGPNLRVLVERADGATFRWLLKLADEKNLVLALNKRVGRALETDERRGIRKAFASWTGTLVAYTKPGKKLGNVIEYNNEEECQRYVFPVPVIYRQEKDMVLVAEHPNFSLVRDGKDLVVISSEVAGIAQFPEESGWYPAENEYEIPFGEPCDPSAPHARYLWRVDNMVSSAGRGDIGINRKNGRVIGLCTPPSVLLGGIVEFL